MSDILTSQEIAAAIGVSPDTVTRIARETAGEAIGRQVGGVWLFSVADAARLKALIRPGPGRPPAQPEAAPPPRKHAKSSGK